MGFFSLFRKQKPEDVCRSIAQKIVLASLRYRQDIPASDNKLSADVGAELVYFLLHVVDREAFHLLGASRRDTVYDEITKTVIADYARAVLTSNAPEELFLQFVEQMLDDLNSRQSIYAQCDSIVEDSFPSSGTMVFAFCFFVHQALGHTNIPDDDFLVGKRNLSVSDLMKNDFPDSQFKMQTAVSIGSTLTTLGIPDELRRLK